MKFTTIITSLASFLAFIAFSGVAATPVNLESRDVFVPPVLYPTAGTVWNVGETYPVVWNTTDHPVNITNKFGRIMLRKGELTTPLILANEFDILQGRIHVTVPRVYDDEDYSIVLFGDSGNFSPKFSIKGSGVSF